VRNGLVRIGVTLAEAVRCSPGTRTRKVTGAIYAGVSEKAKAQIASKLTAAGFGA
jgi:hypothetical protein